MPPKTITKIEQKQIRLARGVVKSTAWLVLCLAFVMLMAWHWGGAELAARIPGFFQMKYNTSLALAAGGAGLLSALQPSKRYTLLAGGFLLFIGGVTLTEYLTGLNLGIDQLMLKDLYSASNPHPGRMAPGSALAFIAAAICLFLNAKDVQHPSRLAALELLGFLVFALGAEGLIGHFQQLTFDYGWGVYARMSPQAAIGFVLLGLGFMSLAWHHRGMRADRMPLWLPALL